MTATYAPPCAEDDCITPAVTGWSTRWCAVHSEEHQIVFELLQDAASVGLTDTVHHIAERAIEARLAHFEERDGAGDLANINAARAAHLSATAALTALDAAGHLAPEGSTVSRRFQVVDGDTPVTGELDDAALESWMQDNDFPARFNVLVHRTITTTLPRALPAGAFTDPAAPALAEAAF